MMSGLTPACSAANSSPVRPNPVAISSKISSTSCRSQMSRRSVRYRGSWKRIPPAPCTTGSTMTAASSSACSAQLRLEGGAVGGVVVGGHLRGEHLARQDVGPQRVHAAVGVAHAHRGEGVAVIAAAPRHQPVLRRAAEAAPVLQRHLHRDLDRDRARVAEEHGVQPVRGDVHEQLGQPGRRFVGQAAEHDVVHRWPAGGRSPQSSDRVAVPVDGRPPRSSSRRAPRPRLPSRISVSHAPLGPDRDDRGHRLGADGAVGMPDVGGVDRADLSGGQRRHAKRA